MSVSKRIEYPNKVGQRLADIVVKLEIKESRNVSQEEVINRYINEGLKRDEKKLKQIKV